MLEQSTWYSNWLAGFLFEAHEDFFALQGNDFNNIFHKGHKSTEAYTYDFTSRSEWILVVFAKLKTFYFVSVEVKVPYVLVKKFTVSSTIFLM